MYLGQVLPLMGGIVARRAAAGLDPPGAGVARALGVEGHEAASGQHPDEIHDAFAHRYPRHSIPAVVGPGRRGDEVDADAALIAVASVQVL